MPVDPDKLAASLGAIDPDSLAAELGGAPAVAVRGHSRAKPGLRRGRPGMAEIPLILPTPMGPVPADREMIAGLLPAGLGTLGGAISKPFAAGVPLAGLGGSVGELGSELLMGEVPDPRRIVQAGATQATFEAGGRGLAKGIQKISGPIMQLALKAGPEVAETALREGISATKFGIRKLLGRLGRQGAETDRIVGQANRLGKPYDMVSLLKGAYAETYPKVEVSMTGDELRGLQESLFKFVGQNPRASVGAKELHKLKRAADDAAKKIYDLPLGGRPTPAQESAAGFYKAFADRARQTLNATVPDYEASNAVSESLIKLKDALVPTAKKEVSKGAQVVSALTRPSVRSAIGAGIGYELPGDRTRNAMIGAAAGAVGASPQALSGLALGMNSPLVQLLLRQSPRSLGGMVQQ